jgi:multiple sugar transport system substrate-binding protein
MIILHIGSSSVWKETFGDGRRRVPDALQRFGRWTCTGDTELVMYDKCANQDAAFAFPDLMNTGEGGITMWFKGTGKGSAPRT